MKKEIGYIILGILLGFVIGYFLGMMMTLDWISKYASQFVDVDADKMMYLINEYTRRFG